jgi:hypothetical protein
MRERWKWGSRNIADARSWTGVLLFFGATILLGTAGRARAAENSPLDACRAQKGDSVLLVGTASGPNLKDDRRVLIERLTSSILVGARAAQTEPSRPIFQHVVAFDEIVLQQKKLQAEVMDSASLVGVVDMRSAAPLIGKVYSKEGMITGYLQPSISELHGDLRIDLQLYCRSQPRDDWRLVVLKKVGGTGKREAEILDLVVDAARRLRHLRGNEKPQAVIEVKPARRVMLGTTVVLDGTRSLDPDHDALVLSWKQISGSQRYLPESGVMRNQIELTADVEGTFEFELTAREVVPQDADTMPASPTGPPAPASSDVATITIEVWRAPNPTVGDSRQIDLDLDHPQPVSLDGRCESCSMAEWRQVAGPQVEIRCPKEPPADAKTLLRNCSFTPSVPGEYAFHLVGGNALEVKTAKVTFLIAPKPFVIAGPRQVAAVLGESLKLDASASYDTLDPDPLFQWEARETPFPKQQSCFPSGDYRNGAMVLTPTGRTATFLSRERKTYHVRLSVRARRFFDQRQMWSYDCSTMVVQVEPRRWTIFLGGGGQLNSGTPDHRMRVAIGANVHLYGAWGVRVTQALFGAKLGRTPEEEARFEGLGGSAVALSYTLAKDAWLARFHFGGYAQVSSSQLRAGPSGGIEFGLPLHDIWVLLVGGNLQYPWSSGESPSTRWELAGWFGVGRMF